jgi:hypothetical protein
VRPGAVFEVRVSEHEFHALKLQDAEQDAVPVLALCNALASGEKMAIATLDGQVLAIGTGPFNSVNWPDADSYLRCAEQLAGIQERVGAFFPLPTGFEPDDQVWMDYSDKLLHGEEVQITWDGATAQCDHDQVGVLLEGVAQTGEVFTFFRAGQETLEFANGKIPLGVITEIAHSTRIENFTDVRAWYDSGTGGRVEVRLEPANNNQMTVRLGGFTNVAHSDPAEPQPTS